LAGGCAPTVWYRPETTQAQFGVDNARCRLASKALNPDDGFSARGSAAFVVGATVLHGIGQAAVRQSDFNDCMQANGYVAGAPDAPAFAVARSCQGAIIARVPRPDIAASVEDRNAAAFSMTMRLYSAGLQVLWAIIKVRRAIVSHDASIISVIIKGRARLRRRTDLRMVPKNVDWSRGHRWRLVGRCQGSSRAGIPRTHLARVKADGAEG